MSSVSKTDVQLFFGLTNPDHTRPPPERPKLELDAHDDEESENDPSEGEEYEEEEEGDEEAEEEDGDGDGDDDEEAVADDAEEETDLRPPSRPLDAPLAAAVPQSMPAMAVPQSMPAMAVPAMSQEERMLEMQSVILELERLRAQGCKLSREWTMADRLEDAQFEVRRLVLHQDELNSVSFLKDGLKMAFSAIEAANTSMGPVLQLQGWSAHACKEVDSHRYDNSLSKIYRKYWRRGSSSPELDICFGILGSLGTWHFKQQFFKKPAATFGGMPSAPAAPHEDSDDDEGLPEGFMR